MLTVGPSDDYNEIFLPLLQRVAKVLRNQLQVAISHGKEVKVGRNSLSPSSTECATDT